MTVNMSEFNFFVNLEGTIFMKRNKVMPEERKLKQQGATMTQPLKWLKCQSMTTPNVDRDGGHLGLFFFLILYSFF